MSVNFTEEGTNFTNLPRAVQAIAWGYYGLSSLDTRDVIEYCEHSGSYRNSVKMRFRLQDIAPVVAIADTVDLPEEFGIDQKAIREQVNTFARTTFVLDQKERERCMYPQINLELFARVYAKKPTHPFLHLYAELFPPIYAVLLRLKIVPDPQKDEISTDFDGLIEKQLSVAKVELSRDAMRYVDYRDKITRRKRTETEEIPSQPSSQSQTKSVTCPVLPLDAPGAE